MGLAGTVLTYGNIRVNAPYEIVRLLDFKLTQKVNAHGKVYITALIPDEDHAKYDGLAYAEDVLEVYETDEDQGAVSIFKGIVTNICIGFKNGVYHMYLEAASFTYLLDQQPKNRSFQNGNWTYYQLFRELVDAYPHGDFIDLRDSDNKLDGFTIQYRETDWEFLKRMASHLQTGLIAEITSVFPRLWVGTSKEQVKGELHGINFTLQKTKSGSRYIYAEVEDTKRFELGDVVVFQRKHWIIDQIHAEMKQGVMTYDYALVPEAGIPREVIHNRFIQGASIEGKVIDLDSEGEAVKLHLSVDALQSKAEGCWFSYPTMYTGDGIGWHCMPELGDHVHLYFPSSNERDAHVIQSLRKRDHKGDEISKPERKLFHTKTQKIARFDDKEVAFSTQKEKILVRLNPASGIHVYSHHDLTFHADTDLVLHGKKVQMTATRELSLTCKTSYIRTDGTLHIKAGKLVKNQVPDAELKAYKSLVQELKGKGYPQWVQDLLLQYKTDYYKAVAAGDKKAAKEAAAKAKQLRQQVAEIDRMPAWARAQMHEYTSQWWEAHGANDKAKQKQMHLLANQLRDNVIINELIRGHSANSYLDANRLEELSGEYADAAHKLTIADQKAIAKEAAALRSKYGVNSLLARENLNKLAKKYPDSFSYKLPTTGDWDQELNAALHDFAKKYGLENKGYGRDVLAVYLHQVANGILPWPKVNKATTPAAPTTKTEPGKKTPTTPEKPTKEEPKPTPSNSSAEEKRKAIVEFAKKFLGKIPYCMDSKIKTMKLDPDNPPIYMDCSDFSSSVYLTILNVHIGGNTSAQIQRGTKVSHENLRKSGDYKNLKLGDLILFDWGSAEKKTEFKVDHVGIYVGDGKFIHEHGWARTLAEMKKDRKPSHNVTIDKLSKDWGEGYGFIYTNVIAVRRIIQDDGSIINK
ncbi:NlpC/P60 family protein [Paenibacillus peoriae]|uniref:NlpC/P60 family protein n=1 Tax=Paenibacillus peoriae TaxID=59893 RepID=UPI00026C63A2|nr:NlpC/P60 family protein [Paenibacillus peoriae]MEC0184393.1 NlpC/P60 family protein [Paenibacillus peoriae]